MAFITDPIGIIGEEEAAKVLKKKGFKILERNWRMGHLEVDLIAENRQEIAFVEVKARTTEFGNIRPEEYVDEDKKHRMLVAANAYIKKTHTDKSPRFDIFGILVNPETEEVTYCNHLENVFAPTLRTCNTGSFNGAGKWRKKKR